MKRAFLLMLGVAILLLVICHPDISIKVTPDHTSTDVAETQAEISRILALAKYTETKRKEVTPTSTLPPSQTPEASPDPEEETITIAGTPLPSEQVVDQPQATEQPEKVAELEAAAQIGAAKQVIQETWITHFDCLVEGHCGNRTASGTYLQEGGRYAACDTDYWSFGTKMIIVGDPNQYVWVCVDTGSAIKGPAHWDVWFYDPADGWKYLQEIGGDRATILILP